MGSDWVAESGRSVPPRHTWKEVFTRSSIICSETGEKFNFRTFVDINSNKCAWGFDPPPPSLFYFVDIPHVCVWCLCVYLSECECVCVFVCVWMYLCLHTCGAFTLISSLIQSLSELNCFCGDTATRVRSNYLTKLFDYAYLRIS